MGTYRAYFINRDDHIESYKLIEAADDEQAVEIAKRYVDGHDVEVWDGDRKVSRLSSIE